MRTLPAGPRRLALPPDSTRQGRAVLRLVALLEACGADLVAAIVARRSVSGEPLFAGYCWRIAALFARLNGGRPRRQIRGQAHHARGRWWWT